jgi:hypothetical protein
MIHSAKGTFGLRIDGVNNVEIDGLTVENVREYSPLGYNMCGACEQCAFEARAPYQIGYAGNMAQAICVDYSDSISFKDVTVRNIESLTGRAFGIALWPGVEETFDGKIIVENILAGNEVAEGKFKYDSRPNAEPEACGIRLYDLEHGYSATDDDHDVSTATIAETGQVIVSCVDGHIGCWGRDNLLSQVGTYQQCTTSAGKSEDLAKSISPSTKSSESSPYVTYGIEITVVVAVIALIGRYYSNKYSAKHKLSNTNENNERAPLIQYGSISN